MARTDTAVSAVVQGGADVLSGADVHPLETAGVFNSLLRLHTALESGDQIQIDRALGLLDDDLTRVSFARADLGGRMQTLDAIGNHLGDENVQLRDTLSKEIDTDLVQVISDLSSKQAAVEASLRLLGRTMQLTLLDFL
jgi:flagellar hook-associated protein 3 FlgL